MCLLCNGWHICLPSYKRTYTPCHAVPKTLLYKQASKQARKANRQPRGFDEEEKRMEREKFHAQIFKFIYFIIRLSWWAEHIHVQCKYRVLRTQFAHTTPHQLCHVMFFMLLLLSLYHIYTMFVSFQRWQASKWANGRANNLASNRLNWKLNFETLFQKFAFTNIILFHNQNENQNWNGIKMIRLK